MTAGPLAHEPPGPGDPGAPTDPRAATGLRHALTLVTQGRAAAAAHVLGYVQGLDPHSRQVREVLARTQLAAGHLVGARCTFAAMVAVAPRDDFAHYGLGLAHARLGDLDQACVEVEAARGLRPTEPRYVGAAELLAGLPGRNEIERLELGLRPVGPRERRPTGSQSGPVS